MHLQYVMRVMTSRPDLTGQTQTLGGRRAGGDQDPVVDDTTPLGWLLRATRKIGEIQRAVSHCRRGGRRQRRNRVGQHASRSRALNLKEYRSLLTRDPNTTEEGRVRSRLGDHGGGVPNRLMGAG